MICKNSLSNNTIRYLEAYNCILNEMIHNMSAVRLTDSISDSFIVQMIPHHMAAIEMSENLLQYTTNLPLQNIAQNIITSQRMSIENMTAVYPICRFACNSPRQLLTYEKVNERIIKNMFYEMECACANNSIDANFMREMIPHHMGAVLMSENALRYNLCPELIPLLKAIISSQKKGICEMRRLLKTMNC